jgi:choline dehydrogenase
MGDDKEAVVDPELRVNGVDNLRVVDAGIMPFIPNGNTHGTTCVIALRAVDLIFTKT